MFDDPLNFPLAAQRCREESGELVAAAKSEDEATILALILDNPGKRTKEIYMFQDLFFKHIMPYFAHRYVILFFFKSTD